jgi:hypothetical protein
MRILAFVQGQYGRRIVEQLNKHGPEGWGVEFLPTPDGLPPIIDEPEEFLPHNVPRADLLLSLTESRMAAQLVTALAKLSGAKAAIMPIDNSAWLPPGLKNQLKRELSGMGVTCVFPKTFCTLTETSAGFRGHAESYQDDYIACFARRFGKPKLKITIDPRNRTILEVTVERGSPCGSTQFVAQKLVGMSLEEVVPQAGLIAHYYPCSASMQREEIDDSLFEPLMNISGYVVNEEVEEQIRNNTGH